MPIHGPDARTLGGRASIIGGGMTLERTGKTAQTIRLDRIDRARADALIRAGVVVNTSEAVRQGLRALTIRTRLESEAVGLEAIRDARGMISRAAMVTPAS